MLKFLKPTFFLVVLIPLVLTMLFLLTVNTGDLTASGDLRILQLFQ